MPTAINTSQGLNDKFVIQDFLSFCDHFDAPSLNIHNNLNWMTQMTLLRAFALLSATLTVSTVAQAGDFDPAKPVVVPAGDLEYFNLNPAIQMADAFGALTEGAHGTFGKFPANFDSGPHTHTGAYHGIVVQGVMINPFDDQANPPEMVAGSYWYVPAGLKHATACISDDPCAFFFFADSGFDFHPVE